MTRFDDWLYKDECETQLLECFVVPYEVAPKRELIV